MSDKTNIEWTDSTWNPIRARLRSDPARIGWHCEHASPGCEGCYAETMNKAGRSQFTGTRLPFKPGHLKDVDVFVDQKMLLQPSSWKEPRMIFVCSMTDLFGRFVDDDMIDQVFAIMACNPRHTFQVLTKRSDRMRAYLSGPWQSRIFKYLAMWQKRPAGHGAMLDTLNGSLRNVWCGVSVEDQKRADERVPDLLATPAAVRWLSCEPLLGPVNLRSFDLNFRPGFTGFYFVDALTGSNDDMCRPCAPVPKLDWIVAGGESGPRARPMRPDWVISLRDQCAAAGTSFLFKQWGEYLPVEVNTATLVGIDYRKVGKKKAGRSLHGIVHDAYPERITA